MKDIRTFMQMFKHLFKILSLKQKKMTIIVLLLTIFSALFEMLGISVIMPLVQVLTYPQQLMDESYIQLFANLFGAHSEKQITIMVGVGTMLIYVLKNVFILYSSFFKTKFSAELTQDIAISVMDSHLHRPYEYFTVTNSAEILQGINGDAYSVEQVVMNIMQFIMEGLVVVIVGIYLFVVDPMMALGVAVFAGTCAIIIVIALKKRMSHMGVINREAATELNQISLHIANGIKDIYVMQKRDEFMNKFKKSENRYAKTRQQYLFAGAMPERLIEMVCIVGIVIVVLIRYFYITDTADFIASLSVFAVAAFRILPSISRMSGNLNGLIFLRPALDVAYNNIIEARAHTELIKCQISKVDELENLEFKTKVEVKHIAWHYKNGKSNILNNCSLVIERGQSIGIIGESGTGKSTLSDILLGLYVPQKGTVTVDGYVISEIPKSWSRMIGYVPQTVFLMDDTVRANIAFGEEKIDDTCVWNALERASLKKFIESLPDGLDTIVGEHGIKFSGGQRQRMAIARALYNQPDILILDEATSALDSETEAAVMEAIESLQGKMTMIIIAHRLSTIHNCNKIYEIVDGQAKLKTYKEVFG